MSIIDAIDLRERASLVGEDVLDLSEFLVQRRRPRARRRVGLRVIHLLVPVDPPAVTEANDLDADVQ